MPFGDVGKKPAEHGAEPAPIQRDNNPVSPKEISKAFLDEENVEFTSSVKISVLPKNSSLPKATRKAMTKNATQI